METHHTFCRICEALCGLEVDVEGGQVIEARPDPENVATRGFGCLKGLKQHKLYASADRLRTPERRVGDRWVEATWDEALADIGGKVASIRAAHGPDSIAMYVGTAAGFSVLHPIFAQGFMTGLGSRSMYSSATQDCANKFAVSRELYGFPFTLPFPDVRSTRCLIVVGANPVVSKWSFLQVPNPTQHLREITARGGKVWVVDPRRTETAKATGEHVFIRPDTDVFFFLSFLHELCQLDERGERRIDRARLERFTSGFDAVARLARAWPAERTAEITRVAPERLRAMVHDYAHADGAALYSSTGVNMGRNGSLCYWLQEVINAASGNLDRRGGTLVGEGVVDFPAFGKKTGTLLSEHTSRVGSFRAVNDALPGGLLADEILTPGERQVRALFVTGGNPLITMPNSARLRRAFEQLELLVTLDIFKNETGSLATWVLPATAPFERADLPFIFPLMLGLQAKPYLQATRAITKPDGEQRDEASIYLDLCRASGVSLFGSKAAQLALEGLRAGRARLKRGADPHRLPDELLLDALLRATGQGSFAELAKHPHGRLRSDHRPATFLGARVVTSDGKVHLAPPTLMTQAEKLEDDFARELRERRRLKLISKRAITTHNSWTHNLPDFVEGDRSSNYLYVHPEDAARAGLTDGALADVKSDTATVRVPIRLLKDLMPGTVALPHGWGHQHAAGLSVASKTSGVNVNLLAADGPGELERVSGMAHLTGIPVEVTPAAGPRDVTSWSGLPPDGAA
ncbi:MAG: molybdopterin-dependent oxidoreductase [Polyangiaceae bacterium]|jgi:anaerobic selenocysteine-containing dehydrogenase|nr:molybdopterin-dependent oxidoreductase [Polyangiaceae bacterium]